MLALSRTLEQRSDAHKRLEAFSRLVSGEKGVSLQRYVLGVMLSSVLAEANRLLERIHDGRYQLYRRVEADRAGLALEVLDRQSGSRRDAASLSGRGTAFLEIDGSAVEYDLAPGQQLIVDTGNLAMMDETCSIDIQSVKGVKNVLFGGEGMFNTVVTGPGHVVLQTMPLSAFAGSIASVLPSKS